MVGFALTIDLSNARHGPILMSEEKMEWKQIHFMKETL